MLIKRNEFLVIPTIFLRRSTEELVLPSCRPLQVGIAWLYFELMWELY